MPQVVAHGGKFGPAVQHVGRMRMPQLMRSGPTQLLGDSRAVLTDYIGGRGEETLHDGPQASPVDTGLASEAGHQRGCWLPLRWRRRHNSLREVAVQRRASNRWQCHPAVARAFADDVQPAFVTGINFDGTKGGMNQLAGTQSGGVYKIEHEAQSLRGGRLPAVGPLQPVGHGAQQLPFPLGEYARYPSPPVLCRAP